MLDASSIEDVQSDMAINHPILLRDIDAFLAETGMSESYLGKKGVGNSEIVPRLRKGGRVWPETEARLRSFMLMRLEMRRVSKRVSASEDIQEGVTQ